MTKRFDASDMSESLKITITGPQGSGKTNLTMLIYDHLKQAGISARWQARPDDKDILVVDNTLESQRILSYD